MVVRANRKFISMTYAQPRAVFRCGCPLIVLFIVENDRSRLPSDREKFCSRSSISHVGLWPIATLPQDFMSAMPSRSRSTPRYGPSNSKSNGMAYHLSIAFLSRWHDFVTFTQCIARRGGIHASYEAFV